MLFLSMIHEGSNIDNQIFYNTLPTIALLTEGLSGEYQAGVWPGISEAAKQNGVNLICFCGGSLSVGSEDPWDYQGNILYEIAEHNNLDGIIIAGSLGSYISDEQLHDFLEKYQHIPVVTLAPASEAIPAIYVDNRSGMRALVTHLICFHKFTKIAFIRGPEGNIEAEERYSLFKNVLLEYGIPLDQNYILKGDFTRRCGEKAVIELLENRVDFEVIVAADDETALGAMQELQANGYSVPEDVAVVGFDDIEESRYITPPLTTVDQPLYRLGKSAVDTLVRLMNKEDIPMNTILKAKLTIRESCGCFKHSSDVTQIRDITSHHSFENRNYLDPERVVKILEGYITPPHGEEVESIIRLFCESINDQVSTKFLKSLDRVGISLPTRKKSTIPWYEIFYDLWKYCFRHLTFECFTYADDLIHKARAVQADNRVRKQGVQRIKTVRGNYYLHEIGDILKNTLDVDMLLDTICEHLPKLQLRSFYLTLYENPQKNQFPSQSRLKLVFVNGRKIEIGEEGILFNTNEILPNGTVTGDQLHILVAEPLYFQEEQFGIIFFEAIKSEFERYEILKEYISGALHSAYLMTKVQLQAKTLAKTNRELVKLQEKERAYLKAIKNELELGRKIQRGFLPQELPHPAGWEVAADFKPAREVSGDFYDTFTLSDNLMATVIADVSGKDVSAALFMAVIRTLVRVFADRAFSDGEDPLDAINVVNDYIIQHHRQRDGRCMFATMFLGLLDPITGKFSYVNAGHNSPIIINKGTIIEELPPTGPAVGLAAEMVFNRNEITLQKGDTVFCFTDGVTEAQNTNGDFFSTETLKTILEKGENISPEGMIKNVTEALQKHIGRASPFDDITMVAIKRD